LVTAETLRKVRRIEITTRHMVDEVFGGEYHSVFKGRGMEFSEVREYMPGDDIRTIDWNVTARAGRPFVKKFVEERELTVIFCVDGSSSTRFGSTGRMAAEVAAELAALLAFSAIKNNDKVGLLIFADEVELFVPPRKGRKHVLRVIREVLGYRAGGGGTNISTALGYVSRLIQRRSVVFLISDFLCVDYERALRVANRRHDVIAVSLVDPRLENIPPVGHLWLTDAETGEELFVDTGDAGFRRRFTVEAGRRREARRENFRQARVDEIEIRTDQPFVTPLISFFRQRERKLHRVR
jgi:uncharacterized protein (DUF58 family)